MYSMMMERKCRGKYYVSGHFEEFERGTFLRFGIDFEEFESGPAQYTTAIVKLKDGRVVTTAVDNIQFIHCRRGNSQLQSVHTRKSVWGVIHEMFGLWKKIKKS